MAMFSSMDISRQTIEKPRFLEVEKFVESRTNSIAQLLKAIDNEALVSGEVTKGPRTAAQRLPRHMRRRAMAHDVRRFPKGMRSFASSYLISKHRKKPPSRFARRKPSNILKSYARRKMLNGKWLETHIWHAKRFRMINRWGFKLADRSYQRGFRAIIRDSNKKCVVRDRSFLTCITISSEDNSLILEGLERLVSKKCGLTFNSEKGLSGKYELPIHIYEKDKYPSNYVGPARFQWVSKNQLVIWCHPSVEETLINQLKDLFGLEKIEKIDEEEENEKNILYSSEKVKVLVYSGEINRFRLFGPLSLEKLAEAIRLTEDQEEFVKHHEQFRKIVNSKDYLTKIANGTVLSIQIEDSRTCWDRKDRRRNWKKEKNQGDEEEMFLDLEQPSTSFWSQEVRENARDKKLPNKDFQKQNAEKIEGLKRTDSKIPILVIFRNTNQSVLDGIEILIPQDFGKDFWVALQRCGVRASGMRDDFSAHLEARALCSPNDDVDSKAGKEFEDYTRDQVHKVWLGRPFNRRCRFWSALSFKYPFTYNWPNLCSDWGNQNGSPPIVCRDLQQLAFFDTILRGKNKPSENLESILIPVKLDFIGRGRPKKLGIICLPTEEDLKNLKINRNIEIIQESLKIKETNEEMEIEEENNGERKLTGFVSLEAAANEKAISLRNIFENDQKLDDKNVRRKRLNKKKRETKKRRKLEGEMNAVEENEQRVQNNMENYRDSANRRIIGRIVNGEQSLLGGCGIGLGFICASSLGEFAANFGKCKSLVLVRNSTSKYYHPAVVSVIRRTSQI